MNVQVDMRAAPASSPRVEWDAPPALRQALEEQLAAHFGGSCSIVSVSCRPSEYRSSFSLEDVDVELEDGTTLALVCKDMSRSHMLADARRIKPRFLYEPLREIETYRSILRAHGIGAVFYGAAAGPDDRNQHWLFLERVAGCPLWQLGEFAIWQDVARWLARTHARVANALARDHARPPLLNYDGAFYRVWLERALAFRASGAGPRARAAICELERRYDAVIDRLLSLRRGIIHGDFYSSNIVVERRGGLRVCAVDWEMAAFGPAAIDLAAFTAGNWSDDERTALASAYYHAQPGAVQETSDWNAFMFALDCAQLHLAVQNLGWARNWTPPREHAHDWMADVVRLLDRLDL